MQAKSSANTKIKWQAVRRLIRMRLTHFSIKIRVFVPILLIIILSVASITGYSVHISKEKLYELVEHYLKIEVRSLMLMFERESELKLVKAKKDLRVMETLFNQKGFRVSDEKFEFLLRFPDASQNRTVMLNKWYLDDVLLNENHDFVDHIERILGSKATIFQKCDAGYVRISTNVMNSSNERAVGTIIPFDSAIAESVMTPEHYFGRAYVVNDWYVTGYEPITYQGEIIGMIFVGAREKDLSELSLKFMKLDIGHSGYPFVFDKTGKIVIKHPRAEQDWAGQEIINAMITQKKGLMRFESPVDGESKIVAFDYFPEFELYIAAFANQRDETRQLMRQLIYGSLFVALLIILVLSVTVYSMTIERLQGYLEAIKSRDKELASTRDALKQSEKLATMGQLSAGIAHEVNNPLGVVLMYSHILLEESEPSSRMYKDLETIATQASRCKTILSGLLNFARKNQIHKITVRLGGFVESIRKNLMMPKTVNFLVSCTNPDEDVSIDEGQMTQVFVNLLNNSIDAVKSTGEISFSAAIAENTICFKVEDNGSGISEDSQKRLFEPFFSTKEMGKGTGLGLAICYGIVKMHNGSITVESNSDKSKGKTFTRFLVVLPAA
ncbi:MAG TPA: hypothetical protein DCG57_20420 [Candidatus Riflebacteria bacterium]|nr:hypothetical protein [Candidatus Riflebacteria bacterium]